MEDFVPYELAVKLKDLGYNAPFFFFYRTDDKFIHHAMVNNPLVYGENIDDEVVIAPTISQVLKWFRDVKNIHIEIYTNASGYNYIISDTPNLGGSDRYWSEYEGPNDGGCWDSYEECAIAAIERVLDKKLNNYNI